MTPLEIAQIQHDAEKREREKIASSLRLIALMMGGSRGLNLAVADVIKQLAAHIEKGELSQ